MSSSSCVIIRYILEDFEKPLKTAEFAPEVYKEQGVSGGKSKSSLEYSNGGIMTKDVDCEVCKPYFEEATEITGVKLDVQFREK